MKRFWWNLRFAWEMNHYCPWGFAWISAVEADDSYDDGMTPKEACYEEMAHWYD